MAPVRTMTNPPGTPGTYAKPWITVSGTASAQQIEEACRALGVRFDRARRTYWQREHLFPLAATRRGGRGSGRFHSDAAQLVVLVDQCLTQRLPHRPEGARSSLVPLRHLIADWWHAAMEMGGDATEGEREFYGRVTDAAILLREGAVPPELMAYSASGVPTPPSAIAPNAAGGPALSAADSQEHDALSLAVLLEFASDPVHPAKRGAWRMSPEVVREVLAAWPAPSGEADDGDRERALGRWVARLSAAISGPGSASARLTVTRRQ